MRGNRAGSMAWAVLGITAILVLVPAAQATPWLTGGHDAARTGNTGTIGPDHGDVAFRTQLPGTAAVSEVVIANGSVYVPTFNESWAGDGRDAKGFQGVVRVDLATGQAHTLHPLDEPPIALSSDGEQIFAFHREGATAVSMADGEQTWETSAPAVSQQAQAEGTESIRPCLWSPAVEDDRIYATCIEVTWEDRQESFVSWTEFVWVLDADTGETLWTWVPDQERQTSDPESPLGGVGEDPRGSPLLSETSTITLPGGAAVVGSHVTVALGEFHDTQDFVETEDTYAEEVHLEMVSLDKETGEVEWTRNTSATRNWHVDDPTNQTDGMGQSEPIQPYSWAATGDAQNLYTREGGQAVALNPGQDGAQLWSEPIGREDPNQAFGAGLPAMEAEAVYMSSAQTIYRFDRSTGSVEWSHTLEPSRQERFPTLSHAITEDRVLGLSASIPSQTPVENRTSSIVAFDKATGELDWRYETSPPGPEADEAPSYTFGVGEGIVALYGHDGEVTVLGRTEASLGAPDVDDEMYPQPGEEVTLDLSDTDPGAFGPATRYRVDWGDGTSTGWQSDPVFTHTYEEAGEVTARAMAGNDEGQTASSPVTMNVGGSEPNLLSEAFAPENQDMTFGILGVALALGGGAIGVTRRRRRRTRLQDALEAVEQAYEETKDRPSECEAQLTERKTHARGLMLDGQLTEEQFRVVEDRVDELARELRLSTVEEFDFLPHRLLTALREVVEDGQVTETEKEGILSMLDADEALTDEYKERVRVQIEAWHERDERR